MHQSNSTATHGRLVTLMAVRPPARFGWIELEGSRVVNFVEKPDLGEGWVNGGFMVLRREVLDYIVVRRPELGARRHLTAGFGG